MCFVLQELDIGGTYNADALHYTAAAGLVRFCDTLLQGQVLDRSIKKDLELHWTQIGTKDHSKSPNQYYFGIFIVLHACSKLFRLQASHLQSLIHFIWLALWHSLVLSIIWSCSFDMLTNLTLEMAQHRKWQHSMGMPLLPTITEFSLVQSIYYWQPDTLLTRMVNLQSLRIQMDGYHRYAQNFPDEFAMLRLQM